MRRRPWRGVFDRSNQFVGTIERVGAKWFAHDAAGALIGIATSAEQATALVERAVPVERTKQGAE